MAPARAVVAHGGSAWLLRAAGEPQPVPVEDGPPWVPGAGYLAGLQRDPGVRVVFLDRLDPQDAAGLSHAPGDRKLVLSGCASCRRDVLRLALERSSLMPAAVRVVALP